MSFVIPTLRSNLESYGIPTAGMTDAQVLQRYQEYVKWSNTNVVPYVSANKDQILEALGHTVGVLGDAASGLAGSFLKGVFGSPLFLIGGGVILLLLLKKD